MLCRYSYDLGGGQDPMTRGGSVLDRNVPQPWAARTTLVLTLTLVAIGLGNLQRMPFLLGEHGGAVFFLLYLLALCLLSVPISLPRSWWEVTGEPLLTARWSGPPITLTLTLAGGFWAGSGVSGAASRIRCGAICCVVF